MPRKQWVQGVGGGGGEPISTNARGVIQTDNYAAGGGIDAPSSDSYPVTLNPAETIQEVNVTANDPAIKITVHTVGGDSFVAFGDGTLGSRDKWEIDKIEVSDPQGSGAACKLTWAGE